jgi:hypothetical protein
LVLRREHSALVAQRIQLRSGGERPSASAQVGTFWLLEPPVAAVAVPGGRGLAARGIMAAVPGRLPLIEPMLATPARAVPGDETEWGAEAKWDGAIH